MSFIKYFTDEENVETSQPIVNESTSLGRRRVIMKAQLNDQAGGNNIYAPLFGRDGTRCLWTECFETL